MQSEIVEEHDIWEEDEDVVRDLMEFQDQDIDFEMPFGLNDKSSSRNRRDQGIVFTLACLVDLKLYSSFSKMTIILVNLNFPKAYNTLKP